jgi:hypothetical protein
VLVIHFGTPCPKMTALGDSLFVPRFALRPWRYADISLARCRLRTTPSNGLTACRMRLHMACAAPGPRGPCAPRRPLRHSGHTHAPTPTGDYAPSLRSPWRAARVLRRGTPLRRGGTPLRLHARQLPGALSCVSSRSAPRVLPSTAERTGPRPETGSGARAGGSPPLCQHD